MAEMSLDDIIAFYGPLIQGKPSRKPRDPVERAWLVEHGDPNAAREDPTITRSAGERPNRENAWKKPI